VVLDPAPPRGLDRARLEAVERGDVAAFVDAPVPRGSLRRLFTDAQIAALPSTGEHVYSQAWLDGLRAQVRQRLEERARTSPLDPGISIPELVPEHPWALELLDVERRGAKAYLPGATAALGEREGAAGELERRLAEEEIVKVDDRELAAYLEGDGRLRRVGDGYAVSPSLYERGLGLLPSLQPLTLAAFRDALGVGRRTAQLLLERYDAEGITLRRGDERVLRRRARS
jgi:selenocysteine-specific elongation factor